MSINLENCSWIPPDAEKVDIDAIMGESLYLHSIVASKQRHLDNVGKAPVRPAQCVWAGESSLGDVVHDELEGHRVVSIPVGVADGKRVRAVSGDLDGPLNIAIFSVVPSFLIQIARAGVAAIARPERVTFVLFVVKGILGLIEDRCWKVGIFRRKLNVQILLGILDEILYVMADEGVSAPP